MHGVLRQQKQGRGRRAHRILGLLLAMSLVLGGIGTMPAKRVLAAGENLVQNPNFAEEDMSAWLDTGATVTRHSQEEAIFDDIKTYATISGRTQSYQGFSQDVTSVVEPGAEYEVSYYVKLSDDFKDANDSGREVFFGPMVVDDGVTKYLRQTYNSEIRGDLIKEIPVGQWVQLSGTFLVGEDCTQVVLRFQQESGRSHGDFSITGVSLKKTKSKAAQEAYQFEDIPSLKDAITAALGEDTIVGMVTHPVDNKKEWALLTKHANAVTTGNELKPDSNFGYSNAVCPGKETIQFNGKELLVPKIDWSRGERFINAVWKHNQENPDNPIRIRGHVLVWHAQTPEWFFHEDYEPSKDYVSKEVMNQRLEWYIKTILEHYVGPDSKYKDLFYGWDVVNEACVGGSQIYRDDKGGAEKLSDPTHGEKSSWWHVYQSNEFIINAFKYANKYAPASLELYYNDFGEIWPDKMNSICELVKAVQAEAGAPGVGTRIDAIGMQAHYGMNDFNIQNFETAARTYLELVGKIQLTELDFSCSSNYDGTEATQDQEYMEEALAYQSIFEVLKKLDAIPGYEVGGITFWGVTDPYSWLQSRSNVGGGTDGTKKQVPLLFDGDYKAKPAYWAFVDPSRIKVVQKKVEARRSYDGKFQDAVPYEFGTGDTTATLTPVWNEEGLKLQVEVKDKSLDGEKDFVTLYVDEKCQGREGITPTVITINRKEASSIGGGYKAIFQVPLENMVFGKEILFDVRITNANGDVISYNDIRDSQETSSLNYALCTFKPALTRIAKGSPSVDGEKDEVWNTAATVWLNGETGTITADAKCKFLWDEKKFYVYAEVTGVEESEAAKTCFEIYLDENHSAGISYDKDDKYYKLGMDGSVKATGKRASEKKVESSVTKTEQGYAVEASFEWTDLSPRVHNLVGFEAKLCSTDGEGNVIGCRSFSDVKDIAAEKPSSFGTIKLATESEAKEETANPDAAISHAGAAYAQQGTVQDDSNGKNGDEATTQDGQEAAEGDAKQEKKSGWIIALIAGIVLLAGGFAAYKAFAPKSPAGGALAAKSGLGVKSASGTRNASTAAGNATSIRSSGGNVARYGATKKKYHKKKKGKR